MRLSALSPFGPIFGKELRTTARRKRTYLLRFLYLAVLLLVLWGIYLEAHSDRYNGYGSYGGVARRAQKSAELGQAFFVGFSSFCIISMALISPILTATAISAERQGKTLPVLLMTPITSWQIISGKLFSRLLAGFTLIGLSLPVLAVVRLLGGVDLDRMLSVIALCVVTSLFTASIGLFFSTFMNRAYAVILLSYATLLFLYLFVPFISALMLEPRGRGGLWFWEIMAAINPFVITIVGVAVREQPFRGISILPTILIHLIGTGLLVMWSGAVLRRLARKQGTGEGGAAPVADAPIAPPPATGPPAVSDSAGGETAAAIAVPYRLQPQLPRTVSDNPILWRELRRPLTARRWQAVVATIVSIGLLLLTYIAVGSNGYRGLSNPETQIGYAGVFCALLTLLLCVVSATAIAGEKESDTWTLLLGTPLSARQIVLAKLAGQFRRLMWPGVLIGAHFLLFTFTGVISPMTFISLVWVMLTFNVIWVATGLYFSLRLKTVTFAVILNLLMPIIAYALVPMVLLIVGNLVGERDQLADVALNYFPYPYLMSAVEGFNRRDRFWLPANHSGSAEEFVVMMFGMGAIYLALTAAIVASIIRRFDRMVGRAVQRDPLDPASTAVKPAAFLPQG